MKNTDIKNPNNDAYWQERGYKKKPENWKKLLPELSKRKQNKEIYHQCDGRGGIDAMFDPLCVDDY
ncbi:MAG: hypothetical protein DHS20C09_13130 [marine bacterium B5-7]|nr:MAG: hypothetical protein DHS20C09_13130 [marine bacterium B5-7]